MRLVPREERAAITAACDPRVFPFGRLLRASKLDELPQLVDILRGKMAVVGPRPEDPAIVDSYYTSAQMETLAVRPGLLSPGSIYNFTHGEALLIGPDPEKVYVETLLPLKLALDLVYVRQASLTYDFRLIGRAASVILLSAIGKRRFREPAEMAAAREFLATGQA
jgi:lipopolysaccharide/colanic/teichoic acid biosynthesis glycosyltransferase